MIQFEVSLHGAELQSLTQAGREYLWQGDPAYWGRRAPILFPIVGQVAGGVFRVKGVEYKMGQHGFARDAEFERVGENEFKMVKAEHPNYPYPCELYAAYKLKDDALSCQWTVVNIGKEPMHFQIGAHPAFNLPEYNANDQLHGYFQCFDKDGKPVNPLVKNSVNGGLRHPYPEVKTINSIIPITVDTFADDAILIEDSQVAAVTLLDKDKKPVLTVSCPQAQAFGLWAPQKPGCPFVCIEPWNGIADPIGFAGDIAERELDHCLAAGESYLFEYSIKPENY